MVTFRITEAKQSREIELCNILHGIWGISIIDDSNSEIKEYEKCIKKSGRNNVNSSKNSHNNKNNGDRGSDCERAEGGSDKGMRDKDGKEDGCEGFDGN
ncbi:hypothetical protein Tco_0154080 [Tanacetum coccineum]